MTARPPLLYLTHRIPYPPNKGDKVRSFNILKQLARDFSVHLGTFVDCEDDLQHIPALQQWCSSVYAPRLHPTRARVLSLRGLLRDEALSLPYYRSASLQSWVESSVRQHGIHHALAFSAPMAQYLSAPQLRCRVVDFCDVDSAKWTSYAEQHRWPMSWLYRREGRTLLDFEQAVAAKVEAATFVTEAEVALFRRLTSGLDSGRVVAVQNGVDADFFAPSASFESPYPSGGPVVVFTGAMDYWPNIDAVSWFAREILPMLRQRVAGVRFYIVGMNPAPAVQALARPDEVVVTGAVEDIRPWLAHADAVAAPLRIARGIQNKVLEAMAMARPVVVSQASAIGLAGEDGEDFVAAATASDYVTQLAALLVDAARRQRMGERARACVLAHYSWSAHLSRFTQLLKDGAR